MSRAKHWRCAVCGWLNASGTECVSCEKRRPRAKATPIRPTFRAWDCVVLALDPAEVSGWAIFVRGRYIESGEHRLFDAAGVVETARVVGVAKRWALELGIPWVVMAERSFGGRMGVGETSALGFWRYALLSAQLLPSYVGLVYPSQWRARVLPKGATGKRDAVREREQEFARKLSRKETVGGDEAAAVGVGKFATHAGETGVLMHDSERRTL